MLCLLAIVLCGLFGIVMAYLVISFYGAFIDDRLSDATREWATGNRGGASILLIGLLMKRGLIPYGIAYISGITAMGFALCGPNLTGLTQPSARYTQGHCELHSSVAWPATAAHMLRLDPRACYLPRARAKCDFLLNETRHPIDLSKHQSGGRRNAHLEHRRPLSRRRVAVDASRGWPWRPGTSRPSAD